MTCAAVQNRLLALPDPGRLPDDLRTHLDGCGLCRRYLDRATALNVELAALPAPPSDDARAAFLESLTAAGPVIRTVPAVPFRSSVSLRDVALKVRWKPIAATAAACLVGVGVWFGWPGEPTPIGEPPAGPRSELIQKVVRYNTELAFIPDPKERVARLADLADDLRAEAGGVYLAVQVEEKEDLRALAKMFEQVVEVGIVGQATRITAPAADRQPVLRRTADRLAAAAVAADGLAASAPPHAKESLARMAAAARAGQAALLDLANRGA